MIETCRKCGHQWSCQGERVRCLAEVIRSEKEGEAPSRELRRRMRVAKAGRCPNCGYPTPLVRWWLDSRWHLLGGAGGVVGCVGYVLLFWCALRAVEPLKGVSPSIWLAIPKWLLSEFLAAMTMPLLLKVAIGITSIFVGCFGVLASFHLAEREWNRRAAIALAWALLKHVILLAFPLAFYMLFALLTTLDGALASLGAFVVAIVVLPLLLLSYLPLHRWQSRHHDLN